jgi:hypothetical protein
MAPKTALQNDIRLQPNVGLITGRLPPKGEKRFAPAAWQRIFTIGLFVK